MMAKAGVRMSARKEAQYVMPTLDLSAGTLGKSEALNSTRLVSGEVAGNNSKTRLSRELAEYEKDLLLYSKEKHE